MTRKQSIKKSIFLSGGNSFLGKKFTELYKGKYNFTTFSRTDPVNPIDLLDLKKLEQLYLRQKYDFIIHLAATIDRENPNINQVNYQASQNIISLAKKYSTPIIFMSSESIYGGNLENELEITENREPNPKTEYAKSKYQSEQLIYQLKTPYLILRGHRFIGFVDDYKRAKQFPDTMKSLILGERVELDSQKIFRPSFLNHICEMIDFYMTNDYKKQLILNSVIEKDITYFQLIKDISNKIGLNSLNNILPSGEETVWPIKSTLSMNLCKKLNYPLYSYEEFLNTLAQDFRKINNLENNKNAK